MLCRLRIAALHDGQRDAGCTTDSPAGTGRLDLPAEALLRLTSGRPERTALLSTRDADTPARRLYRGTGFTDLLTAFRFFPGGDPPYAVMGAELPLRTRPARS